jgi:hypothetical protein
MEWNIFKDNATVLIEPIFHIKANSWILEAIGYGSPCLILSSAKIM